MCFEDIHINSCYCYFFPQSAESVSWLLLATTMATAADLAGFREPNGDRPPTAEELSKMSGLDVALCAEKPKEPAGGGSSGTSFCFTKMRV